MNAIERALARPRRELRREQVRRFFTDGYLVVEGCVPLHLCDRLVSRGFQRLGYDPVRPETWEKQIVWLDHESYVDIEEAAPRAWRALCDVVGGAERISRQVLEISRSSHFSSVVSWRWSDAFVANFRKGADQPWHPPSPEIDGWHIDGSYFRHFLDSPEQAVLTVVCWTDMDHQGGATLIATDSPPVVARLLADHPEGIETFGPFNLPQRCQSFTELTARRGDFVIMSPHMLHASSQNLLRRPRFITNPPVMLAEPLRFHRHNAEDYSLLELSILHNLGVDHLNFQPTRPRHQIH